MPKISDLLPTDFPSLNHWLAVAKDGETVRISVAQIRSLMDFLSSEIQYNGDYTVEEYLDLLATDKADQTDLVSGLNAKVDEDNGTFFDNLVVSNKAAPTKTFKFDASRIAAGQTRILSMPDADLLVSSFMASLLDDAGRSDALSTLGAGYLAEFHNEIINPDFSVEQGGAGPFTVSGYTFDGWILGGTNPSLTREGGLTRYQVRLGRTVAGLSTVNLYQRLETFRFNKLKPEGGNPGGLVTVSFECAALNVPSNLTVSVITTDGESNFNNPVVRGTLNIPVAGNAAFSDRKEFSFNLPAGITQQGIYLSFSADVSNSASWAIRDVELCAGPSTKIFRTRHPDQELSICQRFFQVGTVGYGAHFPAANTVTSITRPLATGMRVTPAVALTGQLVSTNLLGTSLNVFGGGALYFRVNNNQIGFAESVVTFTANARL